MRGRRRLARSHPISRPRVKLPYLCLPPPSPNPLPPLRGREREKVTAVEASPSSPSPPILGEREKRGRSPLARPHPISRPRVRLPYLCLPPPHPTLSPKIGGEGEEGGASTAANFSLSRPRSGGRGLGEGWQTQIRKSNARARNRVRPRQAAPPPHPALSPKIGGEGEEDALGPV